MDKVVIAISAFVVALIMIVSLGCCLALVEVSANNRSWGCYDFRHIHIFNGVEGHCATIEKWYENEGAGIEIKTAEWGNVFCTEGSYILFETNDCPFCGGK